MGETLDERQSNQTFRVLETQMAGGLKGFAPADLSSVVVAYEPVWAIGTGVTATPAQAQEAHLFLRKQAAKLYGEGFAAGLRILYGGSVTPESVDNLMAQPDLDGALVGGASLKAPSFARIARFQVAAKASSDGERRDWCRDWPRRSTSACSVRRPRSPSAFPTVMRTSPRSISRSSSARARA